MLTIIMGKSCSGKNTAVDELIKKKFKPIVTYTSRPRRRGEREGREYHYITQEDFADKIKGGLFAEWKSYDVDGETWYYGSPLEEIVDASRDDKNHVIILTPQGVVDVLDILNRHFSDCKVKVIYLYANRATILKRFKARKDKNDTIERRMKADDNDFKNAVNIANKIVYNNNGEDIKAVANKIIKYVNERGCGMD